MKVLSQAQKDSYRRDGFLFPFPALSAEELAACCAGLARFETWLGSAVADADVRWRSQGYAHSPWLNDLARHPRILDVVEDLIGPDILIWTSTFFIKEPKSPTFAAWHQDGAYFGLEPEDQLVTVWVALSDASWEAGCIEAASRHGNPRMMSHFPKGLANSINRAGQEIVEPIDESRVVPMALRAGEFSLHNSLTPHRSQPNNAGYRRVGIGMNYIPPHVRNIGGVRMTAMLVRGQDRYGHYDLIDAPKAECDAGALATHERVSSAYQANYRVQVKRHVERFGGPSAAAEKFAMSAPA
jgi:non-heme Fe2+,alpha-ketoglutarate-dependent halogenase